MKRSAVWFVAMTAAMGGASGSAQVPAPTVSGVRALLRPHSYRVPMGRPVWVTFLLENENDQPVTLSVPDTEPSIPSPEVGLPLPHIFSSGVSGSVTVTTETGRQWDTPVGYHAPDHAPYLMIAPHASVGTTIDLRDFFPTLRGAGRYRIVWKPYHGTLSSEPIVITIAPLKRAEIVTDEGTMTLRFFYRDAPKTVANFLELAESGFYNGTTFHRIEPGYFIQGGCPRGDGTGIRTDGKRVPAEFNNHPFRKGVVAMALLDDDPDSASSQFFICNTRVKEWDGRYTAFAELVGEDSFKTLDRLMAVPVDEQGRPRRKLIIRSVRVTEAPPNEEP